MEVGRGDNGRVLFVITHHSSLICLRVDNISLTTTNIADDKSLR